jgi:hypothetical protein
MSLAPLRLHSRAGYLIFHARLTAFRLLIAVVGNAKQGTEWSEWDERRLLLWPVDNENVALALTGVIERDSFSVKRSLGRSVATPRLGA